MENVKQLLSMITRKKLEYTSDITPLNHPFPEANKWILSDFVISKLIPIVGTYPYPLDELLLMGSTLAYFKPDMVFEWGTHHGKSARIFYEFMNFLHIEQTEIHSIDLPIEEKHSENLQETTQRAVFVRNLPVYLHHGDGVTEGLKIYTDKQPILPLFFLDGDHSYSSVIRELSEIKKHVKQGVILAHDTFYQGQESKYNCGPFLALQEFTRNNELPIISTALGLPGMSLTYWLQEP